MSFHLSAPDILVRPLHQGDVSALLHLVSESCVVSEPSMDWAQHYTARDAEQFIVQAQYAWRQVAPRCLPLAIIARDSMALVGVMDMHDCCWLRAAASLGIWLATHVRGVGYGMQACQLMIGLAAQWWHFRQLYWAHVPGNTASARLARRLGFGVQPIGSAPDRTVYARQLYDGSSFKSHSGCYAKRPLGFLA